MQPDRASGPSRPTSISPRWLFFWFFGWAAAHGRFMSLFLEERGLDEEKIGVVLSITSIISIVAAPLLCNYADKLVSGGNKKGYELVMVICIICTTLVFCCHVAPELGLLDESHNFSYFLVLRVVYSVSLAPAYPILDSIALNYLLDNGLDKAAFGHERLYGAYGWAIVSFLLGICIDFYDTKIMYLFITALMFAVVYCLIIFSKSREFPARQVTEDGVELSAGFMTLPSSDCDIDEDTESTANALLVQEGVDGRATASTCQEREASTPHRNAPLLGAPADGAGSVDIYRQIETQRGTSSWISGIRSNPNWVVLALLMFSPVAIMFVVLHTVLSGVTSIVENLVFLFFKDSLGASNLIMGFSVVVTVVFEIPMFARSKKLLEVFGQNNLLIIACIAYCVRVVGYTLAPNGFWVLIVEPLHGVSYAGSKMATVDFVSDVTPDSLQATAQGILSSLSAIGKLIGISFGGYIEENYGANTMYRGSAVLMFIFLAAFVILVKFYPADESSPRAIRAARDTHHGSGSLQVGEPAAPAPKSDEHTTRDGIKRESDKP